MITDKDIIKLKKVFATKEDLEKMKKVFATKEDLKKLEVSTKEDIEQLALMTSRSFQAHERRFDQMEKKFDEKFDRLFSHIDGFLVRLERLDQEHLMIGHQLSRHDKWINHLADTQHIALPQD